MPSYVSTEKRGRETFQIFSESDDREKPLTSSASNSTRGPKKTKISRIALEFVDDPEFQASIPANAPDKFIDVNTFSRCLVFMTQVKRLIYNSQMLKMN